MEIDQETGEVKAKGKGSFWISKQAIGVLLNQQATALQIAAYLVIAKHTDEGGKFSTSGIKAIHTATGVSHSVAQKAVDALMQMAVGKGNDLKLIYKADKWQELTAELIPPAPFERVQVRYVVNDYKAKPEDKVWISNELITGYGKFTQPLKKLKLCGDAAARLLLIGYRENDLEQYGGINPQAFHHKYEMSKIAEDLGGYALWHGKASSATGTIDWNITAGYPILNNENRSEASQVFFDALNALDKAGFIYEMVSVMDRAVNNPEAQVIYELDAKSKHGYKPKGEEGLGGQMAVLSNMHGYPVTDSTGRFYGKYAAIVPAGEPYIIGIYRLRFRVSNNKNHGVATAWARIFQGQRDAKMWLSDVLENAESEVLDKAENTVW